MLVEQLQHIADPFDAHNQQTVNGLMPRQQGPSFLSESQQFAGFAGLVYTQRLTESQCIDDPSFEPINHVVQQLVVQEMGSSSRAPCWSLGEFSPLLNPKTCPSRFNCNHHWLISQTTHLTLSKHTRTHQHIEDQSLNILVIP